MINGKLHISEVSFSSPKFYNLTTNIYGVCTSDVELTNTNMTGIILIAKHTILSFSATSVCVASFHCRPKP